MTHVRPVEKGDALVWAQMRHALWPEGPIAEHAHEIDAFFRGGLPDLTAAFAAVGHDGTMVGFAELAERSFAEGCTSQSVAYLEGWYVASDVRGRGVGRALVQAAEAWARKRGHRELASDTELENETSAAAHLALGFEQVAVIRCFRKALDPGDAT